jgi:alpha-pyrone synthase
MIANALFGDGAAAVLMETEKQPGVNLRPKQFVSELTAIGGSDMAWQVGDLGFEMKLSSYVPAIIKDGILQLTNRMLESVSKGIADIRYYALHPGGRKILENIEHELGLTKVNNAAAYEVLKNFGNMSSPTVLFVLAEVVRGIVPGDNGEHILSFAFGPGITLESMLLKIELA